MIHTLLYCGLLVPTALAAQPVQTTIIVSNIQVGKGTVVIRLYNKEQAFFKTAYLQQTHPAKQAAQSFVLSLPAGTYAIAAYQDFDSSEELNLGLFNIPKEPVGFGNNFKPKWSAPTFADCAVLVEGKVASFTIRLH